jgi:hypothetical protein
MCVYGISVEVGYLIFYVAMHVAGCIKPVPLPLPAWAVPIQPAIVRFTGPAPRLLSLQPQDRPVEIRLPHELLTGIGTRRLGAREGVGGPDHTDEQLADTTQKKFRMVSSLRFGYASWISLRPTVSPGNHASLHVDVCVTSLSVIMFGLPARVKVEQDRLSWLYT